ncbi:MAG: translation initiation factor IF-2 [Phycisphaeraceae bacterium]|nr:translation initiation factor IF-2 [Phycisphaeraceae bacterium]
MAKRVYELAKELEIPSKVIIEKCTAEGMPGLQNHMSSITAGQEATIREWFTVGEGGTAVETAARVDVDHLRAPSKARKKAAKKSDAGADDASSQSSVTTLEPPPPATPAPAAPPAIPSRTQAPAAPSAVPTPTPQPAAAPPARPAEDAPAREPAPTARATPTHHADAPPAPTATPTPAQPVAPAAHTVAPPAQAPAAPKAPSIVAPPSQQTEPSAPARAASAPAPGAPGAPSRPRTGERDSGGDAAVRMNVPDRPKSVKPVGQKLEIKTPAKLSGPKIVRVEAAEVVDVPGPRRGPGGGGQGGPSIPSARGPRGGSGVRAGEDDASRRNKRRGPGGPGGAPGGAPAAPGAGGKRGEGGWRQADLIEREERLSRAGGFLRQRRRDATKGPGGERATTAAQTGGAVRIAAPFTIKDLSAATGVKASDIVKQLFMQGVMATVNSGIEPEKAQEIMIEYDIELDVVESKSAEEVVSEQFSDRETIDERPRSTVVTILGHVDHGKTSLLDKIRNANVASGEAGGITQATSAFRVPVRVGDDEKFVTFLDTPGHEAFTAMRSRGANMTDVVVLVVAADDGVMPQTIESINHAKAAGVPIVVALNKIDKPEATDNNIQRIFGQLAERGLNPTEWGGDTEVVRTSATKGTGIQDLLEVLDYQSQLLDLKADFKGPARGTVIESRMEEGRGATASVLVQNGELCVGDFIVAGRAFGRVRDITDDRGNRAKSAIPSSAVQLSGLDELPNAGDKFYVVDSLKQAQQAAEQRRHRERERELATPKATLDSILTQLKDGERKELLVVIKADVQGSVDVLKESVQSVSGENIKVRVLHAAVGGINDSDVILAEASGAIIVGFNVIPSAKARRLAEDKKVGIRTYQVIYDIVDDIKGMAEGLLEPELRQEILGHAEVRQVFKVSKVGAIAGCYVTDGVIERNAYIRVTRGDIVIENDRLLEQLKRFKDDAKEVRMGQECGMKIVGYDDIKEGDILECYKKVEIKRTL